LYGNVERGLAFIINNVGVCTESKEAFNTFELNAVHSEM
jgi:hypothetical protein